jgi:hypothetical protein
MAAVLETPGARTAAFPTCRRYHLEHEGDAARSLAVRI